MGKDWKIYIPNKVIDEREFIKAAKVLKSEFINANVTCTISKPNVSELIKLNEDLKLSPIELNATITTKNYEKFNSLYEGGQDIEFGIFRTKNSTTQKRLGFEALKSNKNLKPNFRIHLPYGNIKSTRIKLSELLLRLNEPLCLGFRDRKQLDEIIQKLISNSFDTKYLDSQWSLKHSHHTFSFGSYTKQMFEKNEEQTFRPTSLSIIINDGFEKLFGWKEFSRRIIENMTHYFKDEELYLYITSKNLNLLEELNKLNPISTQASIKYDISQEIKLSEKLDLENYFSGIKSDISIEYEQENENNAMFFRFYTYRTSENEIETRFEIDINADKEYENKLLDMTNIDFKYSHSE